MFAEKEIVGESLLKVSKGRQIILPDYSYATPGDQVGLFYGITKEQIPEVKDHLHRIKITIMRLTEFEELLTNFQTKLKEQRQNGKISYHKCLELQRIFYAMLAISREEVSKLGKITIEQVPIRNLNITDSVYAVGNGYHLDLYPSKEIYIKAKSLK